MTKSAKQIIVHQKTPAGGIYFLTFIGAAVHFVGNVDGFWNVVLALLKSTVWPAFLVHRIFDLLRI